MSHSLIAAVLVLSGCAAPVDEGSDEWEDIEDVVDPGAMSDEEWEAELTAADAEDPDDPDLLGDPESVGAGTGELGSGEGGPGPINDPCKNPPEGHVIRGTNHADHLTGTPHRDIIFGYGGDDVIDGGGGNDIICAGFGRDRVRGGAGDDYIDGGGGRDLLWGGDGNDIIHGRAGGDVIHGGRGDDEIYGDILDDRLWGDSGNDLIIGGHGVDRMHGGAGDDWLRGDTNGDEFYGGSGNDTASFMTAMPPGQPLPGLPLMQDGIVIRIGRELASGDGYKERVLDIENVIGSAFNDVFYSGDPSTRLVGGFGDDTFNYGSGVEVVGGAGADTCNGGECEPGMEASDARTTVLVFVDPRPKDTGLVVLGAPGDVDDVLDVLMRGDEVHVIATGGPGITPGTGCDAVDDHEVACSFDDPLRYLMAWGGDGNDTIRIGNGFPRELTSHVGGGPGDDHLYGGDGQDVLFTGVTGSDWLYGDAGDDALIGESPAGPPPLADAYGGGDDHFFGGPGNDQLVTDYPCGHHEYHGGRGLDIAGFARVGTHFATAAERRRMSIRAQLGGRAARSEQTAFYGRAYQPYFCGLSDATTLAGDLEILEGAGGNDLLHGNDRSNFIWGWGGDDLLDGHGGNDVLEGLNDDDHLVGGPGVDRLRGGKGNDVLDARDGGHDAEINCGYGGGTAVRDPGRDPAADRCGAEDGTAVSSGVCAGPRACTDANGDGVCVGDRGITTCTGGHRECTCTNDGWASCGTCTPG